MFEAVRGLNEAAEFFPRSGTVRVWGERTIHGKATIAVVCAGTSDIPVAEEACVTAEVMGNEIDSIYDVGVAGIHRLLSKIDQDRGRSRGDLLCGDGGSACRARWGAWCRYL